MKLYATVTSERASKGQGGNKYLTVFFKGIIENRIIDLWCLQLKELNGTFTLEKLEQGREGRVIGIPILIKGEQQKGKICNFCGLNQAIEGGNICGKCTARYPY